MAEPTATNAMTNATAMNPYQAETVQERLNIRNARAESNLLLDENIIAKPLQIPGYRIKLKNPAMVPYWANRSAKSGRRVRQLHLAGFKVVTPTDIADAGGMESTDGKYVNDDLLLMMAPKELYYGALKYNADKAQRRLTRAAIGQAGAAELQKALHEVPAPNALRQKIQAFMPGDADLKNVGREPGEVVLSEMGQG